MILEKRDRLNKFLSKRSVIVNTIGADDYPSKDLTDDIEEGEDWKVDNGIAEDTNKFQNDTGFKSPIDIHMEWRRKHQGNN